MALLFEQLQDSKLVFVYLKENIQTLRYFVSLSLLVEYSSFSDYTCDTFS